MKKIVFFVLVALFIAGNCFATNSKEIKNLSKEKKPALSASVKKVQSFIDKVKSVDKNSKKSAMPKKTVVFNEQDINEYLNYLVQEKNKKLEVDNVKVKFVGNDILKAEANVIFDLAEVFKQEEDSLIGKILKKASNFKNSFDVQVRIFSNKGKYMVVVQSLKINGIKLPDTLVQVFVKHIGKKQKPPIDMTKFVDLPYGVQKIEISSGIITIKL